MNGIIIDEIRYENFRQYGTGSIKLSNDGQYQLSILVAQNGTGKTTFLNSITWCLYEKEFQLSDKSKALPVVNTKVLKETPEGERVNVSVSLTVLDGDKVVEFKRSQALIARTNAKGVKNAIEGASELVVSITVKGDLSNTQVIRGTDTDFIVKQYFHDEIPDFYFFDGEKLKEFFAVGREKDIKRSIYNISQVSLLTNVCDHVKKLVDKYTKALAKDFPDIEKLDKDKDAQEQLKQSYATTIETCSIKVRELTEERTEKEAILRQYGPTRKMQAERDTLNKEQDALEDRKTEFFFERSKFIRRYSMLINYYPYMKKVLSYITSKEEEGELPPGIDIDMVKKLLEHLDEPCPLCNHDIGETGKEHLEGLLTRITVSSRTSNFLSSIKGPLESAIAETEQYKKIRKDFIQKEQEIEEEESRISKRLEEINKYLVNFENNEDEKVNVAKLESRVAEITMQLNTYNQSIGSAKTSIEMCDKELARIQDAIDKAQEKLDQKNEAVQMLSVLNMMDKNYRHVLLDITGSMKDEIESITREIFDSMNWKEHTFGELEIDDNYALALSDADGLPMIGSISATELMALAYAFILAIHKASGRNCPLVIDSPIGRSSDQNREYIANELLKVSKEKQIVMLFTPDDFTEPVQKLYSEKAKIIKLHLSADEKFVEGIDA